MSNPGQSRMIAAKHILRYLAGTSELGLTYVKQPAERANLLWEFAGADHAGDIDSRRSVTGYIMMLMEPPDHGAPRGRQWWHSAQVRLSFTLPQPQGVIPATYA